MVFLNLYRQIPYLNVVHDHFSHLIHDSLFAVIQPLSLPCAVHSVIK
jgi:hypothetical protein